MWDLCSLLVLSHSTNAETLTEPKVSQQTTTFKEDNHLLTSFVCGFNGMYIVSCLTSALLNQHGHYSECENVHTLRRGFSFLQRPIGDQSALH